MSGQPDANEGEKIFVIRTYFSCCRQCASLRKKSKEYFFGSHRRKKISVEGLKIILVKSITRPVFFCCFRPSLF